MGESRGLLKRKGFIALASALVLALIVASVVVVAPWRDGGEDDAGNAAARENRGRSIDEVGSVSDDVNTVTILAPTELGAVLSVLIEEFSALEPDTTVQLLTGESRDLLQRVQAAGGASVYIDDAGLLDRVAEGRYVGNPVPFGSDLFRILVARGNPKGVSSLGIFGADPNTTSGMCSAESACGPASARILERAGVLGTPDVVLPSDDELTVQVAAGEIDAALVLRSAARTRLRHISSVAIPTEYNVSIHYEIARLRDAVAVNTFVEFLQTHETARTILTKRGYLSFYS